MENTGVRVASCTLAELLNAHKTPIPGTDIQGQLTIPEYQRPYVWKEKQINRLLDDLLEYDDNKDDEKALFYLGSIILHQFGDKLNIIDGQQRITTMLIINKIKNDEIDTNLEVTSSTSISNIKTNFAYLNAVASRDIYDYANRDVLESIDFSAINVTLVVTENEDMAYTFFETQNTGGVRLSGSDIIKAHHLRAVNSPKLINYQAKRWESIENTKIEEIIRNLTKVRFWDNRRWRTFPFYRDERGIKGKLIDEFTENTKNDLNDISYYYSAVEKKDGKVLQMHESQYKQLKQPLSNGNNTLDYVNEYVGLYDLLFTKDKNDHNVSDDFYDFYNNVIRHNPASVFLRELFEICIIAYVSRFGFLRLFEASLWIFRAVFSLRVSKGRNVREDSVFKFVFELQFIDNILEVYTIDELLSFLKRFNYQFSPENMEENQSKDRYIKFIRQYFKELKETNTYSKALLDTKDIMTFDKDLRKNILTLTTNSK